MIIFMLFVLSGDVSVGGTAVGAVGVRCTTFGSRFVGAAFGSVGTNDIVVGGGVGVGAGVQAAITARMMRTIIG
jgi:hypothetical protein